MIFYTFVRNYTNNERKRELYRKAETFGTIFQSTWTSYQDVCDGNLIEAIVLL